MVLLSTLRPKAQITFISCKDEFLAAKLADMGMLPGSAWQLLERTPFYGPLVMSNGQTHFCIRREDASNLLVDEK